MKQWFFNLKKKKKLKFQQKRSHLVEIVKKTVIKLCGDRESKVNRRNSSMIMNSSAAVLCYFYEYNNFIISLGKTLVQSKSREGKQTQIQDV
jgi:hypothetical protein